MAHLVLLGDSIFDNAAYVPGQPAVIEHLRAQLGNAGKATLLAVDGAVVASVHDQLAEIPPDASHLILSAGGNDAIWEAGSLFPKACRNVEQGLSITAEAGLAFAAAYQELLQRLLGFQLPLIVCTIYDSVPGLSLAERAGLCMFNDAISRAALQRGLTLIELRTLCQDAADYSSLSPIEPSSQGGHKIAQAIVAAVLEPQRGCRIVARCEPA